MEAERSKPPRGAIAALIVGCVLVRAALIAIFPIPTKAGIWLRDSDDAAYFRIAHSIVERGEFVETNLRAYRPPLYPAFLALYIKVFGDGTSALPFLQNLMFLIAAGALAVMAARLYGWKVGACCAALIVISPTWILLPQDVLSESLFILFLSGAVVVAVRASERPSLHWAAACGALFGAAALAREMGLYFGVAAVASLWIAIRARDGARAATRHAAAALLGIALLVGPWTARNYHVFGRFVPITTNGPINLYVGNNPLADGRFFWVIPPRAQEVWNTPSERGAAEMLAADLSGSEALRYMREHPRRTAELSANKLLHFWLPPFDGAPGSVAGTLARVARTGFQGAYGLLALAGLFLMRATFLGRTLIAFTAIGCVIHSLMHIDGRFRAPFDALLAIPVACVLVMLIERIRARYSPTSGPPSSLMSRSGA